MEATSSLDYAVDINLLFFKNRHCFFIIFLIINIHGHKNFLLLHCMNAIYTLLNHSGKLFLIICPPLSFFKFNFLISLQSPSRVDFTINGQGLFGYGRIFGGLVCSIWHTKFVDAIQKFLIIWLMDDVAMSA